ncbi:ABC transporter substrate-binding protein [Variovorax sp. J31P207]|uniref:ABC transporter substrate-binding protein n=1 Tax=Variovorax sp. J31P207 TaxID=3053510 RepID=UPI0025766502|nr:ABC transporter substrate-binding protein [Variovorax sp. J31P207]MDM0070670.1 ABC transporter substrate-binding protein [Variovorax sp. J31P207]
MLFAQGKVAAMPRVGVLLFGAPPAGSEPYPIAKGRRRLLELGYIEGQNIELVIRHGDGPRQLAEHAADLVRSKVDVIFAGGPLPLDAARGATDLIPIVAIAGGDPVRDGWARSFARPGGNVTGLTVIFPEVVQKQFELLRLAVPGIERVALLLPGKGTDRTELEASARNLRLDLLVLEVADLDGINAALERAARAGVQGLVGSGGNFILEHRFVFAELAIKYKLPSISVLTQLAEAGFLMSYGVDLEALGRRGADYIDKILKGTPPGELPIERPKDFQFVINRKTAKTLNLSLPQSLVMRANRIVD